VCGSCGVKVGPVAETALMNCSAATRCTGNPTRPLRQRISSTSCTTSGADRTAARSDRTSMGTGRGRRVCRSLEPWPLSDWLCACPMELKFRDCQEKMDLASGLRRHPAELRPPARPKNPLSHSSGLHERRPPFTGLSFPASTARSGTSGSARCGRDFSIVLEEHTALDLDRALRDVRKPAGLLDCRTRS